jgi:phosphatidylglycerophosphate synthase
MFDEPFRRRFQPAVRPLVTWLAQAGVTPNSVTVLTFVVGLAGALSVVLFGPTTGVVVWLLSRVGDGLDGALARVSGQSSAFGGFLDITLDMIAYSAMVLAFSLVHPEQALGWCAVLAGYVIVITTTLALSDAARGRGTTVSTTDRTFQFTRGLTEAGETNAVYVVWALFPEQLYWTVWVWVALLIATGGQRMWTASRALC